MIFTRLREPSFCLFVIVIRKALRADPPKGTGMMHVASSASLMHDGRVGVSGIVSVIVIVTVTLGIALILQLFCAETVQSGCPYMSWQP